MHDWPKSVGSAALMCGVAVSLSVCGGGAAFRGEGVVTDNGRVAFPRYEVAMRPPMSLRRAHTYTFEFSGMPTDKMDFGFRPTSRTTERDVRAHAATLRSKLRQTDTGKVISDCAISTKADEITVGGDRSTGEVLHIWSRSCADVRLNASTSYSLTVAVEVSPTLIGPQVDVEAVFRGGGIELP